MDRNRLMRILAMGLALFAMVAGAAFAGGQKEGPAAKAAPAGPVDLDVWVTAAVSESGPPPADWIAYKVMKDKLGINLKVVFLPSNFTDMDTKINTAAAANSLPDLFAVNPDVLLKLIQLELVAPVDDLIPLMPKRRAYYQDEVRRMMVTVKGKMYGFPEMGAIPQREGLVVRKDWLNKLGLQPPKTTDEFFEVAKAFTEKDPDGNGKNDTYGFGAYIDQRQLHESGLGYRFDPIFGAFGIGGVWNVESQATFGLNARRPEFMQALKFLNKMVQAGVIDPDWPTVKKDEFRARWKQGKFGMMREDFAALATMSNYKDFDKNFPDGEWLPIAPPTGPAGKSALGNIIKDIRIHAISARAAKAGKGPVIAKMLDWMADPGKDGGYYLLGFGVEGENYVKDAEGIVSIEGIPKEKQWTSKEMQPFTQLRNLVINNSPQELASRYPAYKTAKGRTMDPIKSYWSVFQTFKWIEATGASLIKPTGINQADFVRYYNENVAKFVLGQQPLDQVTYDKFLAGLDSLGAKTLEENARKQLIEAGLLK